MFVTEIPHLQGYNVSFSVDIEFPHPGIYVLSSRIAYFARDLNVAWSGRAMPFPLSHNLVDEVIVVPDDRHQARASCPHDINQSVNSSSNASIQPSLPLKAFVHDVSDAIGQALNARGVALVHASGDIVNIEQAKVILDHAAFFRLPISTNFQALFIRAAAHASAAAMYNLAVLNEQHALKSRDVICAGALKQQASQLGHSLAAIDILHKDKLGSIIASCCIDHPDCIRPSSAPHAHNGSRHEVIRDLASMFAATSSLSSISLASGSPLGFNDMDPDSALHNLRAEACLSDAVIVRLLLNPTVMLPLSAASHTR